FVNRCLGPLWQRIDGRSIHIERRIYEIGREIIACVVEFRVLGSKIVGFRLFHWFRRGRRPRWRLAVRFHNDFGKLQRLLSILSKRGYHGQNYQRQSANGLERPAAKLDWHVEPRTPDVPDGSDVPLS